MNKKLKVNPTTMCFVNMLDDDKKEITRIAREAVITGTIDYKSPYVEMWLNACCDTESQRLIMASSVLPLRFFLSVTDTNNMIFK